METTIQTVRDITLLIGRVTLGVVFIAHGWTKHTNGTEWTPFGFDASDRSPPATADRYQ
jgi:uncharacterized membrane protein YphA (DoxX/SURF4 family)